MGISQTDHIMWALHHWAIVPYWAKTETDFQTNPVIVVPLIYVLPFNKA